MITNPKSRPAWMHWVRAAILVVFVVVPCLALVFEGKY